jgi:MOSC domain-containing protein YiiM
MRLLSIQTGRPTRVGTPGAADPMEREFTSAIWKSPVAGPVRVTRLGLEGDAVADTRVHGGPDQALLMYDGEHYPRWRAEWGVADLGAGAFGENLTVAGLSEESVCVGDVLEIGPARLQVTATRQPCANLARRHQRRDLVREVYQTGRSGWYLRVLDEGTVSAGLPVRLLERPNPEWTVRAALLAYRDRARDPDRAAALGRCVGLSERWTARLLSINY